jgi:hypothetical protein
MHQTAALSVLALLLWPGAAPRAADAKVPKEVEALQGTYTGSWESFGIDEQGKVVRRAAWTDTVKAEAAQVQGDRAFVTMLDEMTFAGGKVPPRKVAGKEGYFLKPDGGLGDAFVEVFGRVQRMRQLEKNVWTSATPADPRELAQLGFPKEASGQHVLVKVVTEEDGVETHRISRVTTVRWKGKDGKERWLQYVSLRGFHKRKS